ncbi:DNA gyrase subunit A [Candidatus Beckwithbacteria bacterium CG10_big_fil_rev_8_21_14_0_10_34_10]|uniref:DNA gyrase subunit A n=1 Tax=Candidatus Beckwithbacteria bacterium CG10_big_fil_rev_8_21_14_0_10_34_10 TaxID=1974495 RepID=A0A2H0W7S1_9BACT|nr:MAG: DNA gyrase subunit A [Candidatus Beckwithbacteria bacterium CG10_big_fil_rev_8_21_14_0_10_34_10]
MENNNHFLDDNNNGKIVNRQGIGKILQTKIVEEMKRSYLNYSMSVIVSRALPDLRDGLKPVQRRILYAMYKMGLSHSARYTKSAKVTGECMGKYHPHGDQAIYDALVRMAQDFSLRYPLVDGHGNFGSVDGDPAAAMRYTEVRMAKISQELLLDIDKKTVDFIDNFDASLKEPAFLPAKLPNLLLMGADGIAVGMATKIPPHNLNEVAEAIKLIIQKGKSENLKDLKGKDPGEVKAEDLVGNFYSEATIDDLLEHINGPDFPTAGEIYNWNQIKEAYTTGRGKIIIRAKTSIEEARGGKYRILIKELPYQVNKARLIQKIAQMVKGKKIKGISGLRDESDRKGMQVVIELKREGRPKAILNNLYKHSSMQTSFPVNMVTLIKGTPQLVNLKTILQEFVKHRLLVIAKKSQFELKSARDRAHILEGLKIALDNLDAVIETIKKSPDADIAKERLMKKFKLTEVQAVAILDMQLRRLAALERKKIEDEYKMIQETIKYLLDLLMHPKKILKVIVTEIDYLKKTYGDERKTKVFKKALEDISEEDMVPKQECLVTITKTGYIKRLPMTTYRSQRRGGKGVTGMNTKDADEISEIMSANTHDHLYFFTDRGKVFFLKVFDLPETSRQSKGQAIINLININQGEKVQAVLRLPKDTHKKYLLMITKKGQVKKTDINSFKKIRTNGLIAIRLKSDDRLIKVVPTSGDDEIMIITHEGKAIKFKEADVRPMGRSASGMKGIKTKEDDYVVAAEVLPGKPNIPQDKRRKFFQELLVVTEKGLGKKTPVKSFPIQKRAGVGVKVAKVTAKTGKIVAALLLNQEIKQIVITSKKAQVIKLPVKNIRRCGRDTQGVILMRFAKENDLVAAVAFLKREVK